MHKWQLQVLLNWEGQVVLMWAAGLTVAVTPAYCGHLDRGCKGSRHAFKNEVKFSALQVDLLTIVVTAGAYVWSLTWFRLRPSHFPGLYLTASFVHLEEQQDLREDVKSPPHELFRGEYPVRGQGSAFFLHPPARFQKKICTWVFEGYLSTNPILSALHF